MKSCLSPLLRYAKFDECFIKLRLFQHQERKENNCSHKVTYISVSTLVIKIEGMLLISSCVSFLVLVLDFLWLPEPRIWYLIFFFFSLSQLLSQCNTRFVECFSAHKDCNKEKNRNSSVVPCEYLLQHPHSVPVGCANNQSRHSVMHIYFLYQPVNY